MTIVTLSVDTGSLLFNSSFNYSPGRPRILEIIVTVFLFCMKIVFKKPAAHVMLPFRFILLLGLCCYARPGYAQTTVTDSFPPLRAFVAGLHYGSIFAHSTSVQNTAGSNPRGLELQLMKQQAGRKAYNLCRCYPKQSILAAAYNLDNEVLGWSGMAAYMLEPSYRISNRLFFSMRGSFGLAYASNKYDANTNPTNQSYSTTLNTYLLYGLGIQWQFSPRMALQLTGNFQHISNGGLKEPNKGVNWPTAGLHFLRYNRPVDFYRGSRQKDDSWRRLGWRKDLAVFAVGKRWIGGNGKSKRLPVAGLMAQIGKQVGVINQLNTGAEWSYDGVIDKRLKDDSIAGSPHKLAIIGGHEFLLGRFIFSQQLGIYVFKDNPYTDDWFHRWGLLYRAGNRLWFGLNLKAHRHVADYIDLRVVYSWR